MPKKDTGPIIRWTPEQLEAFELHFRKAKEEKAKAKKKEVEKERDLGKIMAKEFEKIRRRK